jgi:hypothetical protein
VVNLMGLVAKGEDNPRIDDFTHHAANAIRVLKLDKENFTRQTMKEGMKSEDQDNAQQQAALLIALRTGLLRKCPHHGDVYDPGQHDFQGACMVATFLVNCNDPLVAPFLGDRAPLTSLLRSICLSYGKACPHCSVTAHA